jgi:hypothetical protein
MPGQGDADVVVFKARLSRAWRFTPLAKKLCTSLAVKQSSGGGRP